MTNVINLSGNEIYHQNIICTAKPGLVSQILAQLFGLQKYW